MKIYSNSKYNTSFKGRMPIINNAELADNIKRIMDCKAGHIAERLTSRIKLNPNWGKFLTEDNIPTKPSKLGDLLESFLDMAKMPRAIFANTAKLLHNKFPQSKSFADLFNSKFVQKHFEEKAFKTDIATLRGVYINGKKYIDELKNVSDTVCGCGKRLDYCNKIRSSINEGLNEILDFGKSKYDTKYERFITRLVSGFTAAAFLGKDFFNKAKMSGKNDVEAQKDKKEKVNQEVIANIGEAISQFAFLATFPVFANTKKWVTPLVSAGIGFLFNIISRIIVGRPLTRIKSRPVTLSKEASNKPVGIEDFKSKVKGEDKTKNNNESNIPKKKSLLSAKNILMASCASIAAGFAIRYGKAKFVNTELYDTLRYTFKNSKIGKKLSEIRASEFEELFIDRKEANRLTTILKASGEESLATDLSFRFEDIFNNAKKPNVFIGRKYKTVKLFEKMEVPLHKLHNLPLAPFEFVKNIVAFPYQKALQLAEGLKWVEKIKKPDEVLDPYKMRNILYRFREFTSKYGDDDIALVENFKKYLQETREVSLNSISASKIDNEKITVAAQVLGMLFGITFNMNDDYNKTIEHGDSVQEAEKAARLRGLNKFSRTSIQAVIAGTLNTTLAKQYNGNLVKAGLITATATILTDVACRLLTGMPFRQMTKQEQEKYKQKQEDGISGKYFKFIDKLAS